MKPTDAVTNTMDKDGLWCGGLWSCGNGRATCYYDDNCGGWFGFPMRYPWSTSFLILHHIASKIENTGGLWSTGKGCAMCDYGCDDNYGGWFGFFLGFSWGVSFWFSII